MSALTVFIVVCALTTGGALYVGSVAYRKHNYSVGGKGRGIAIATGIILVLSLMMAGIGAGSRTQCRNTADAMDVEHRWGYFLPCMVKVEGRWFDLDGYRGTEDVSR